MMFLEKYKDNLAFRYPSMGLALNWFEKHGGKVIVETGCVRQEDDWGAGMSTKLFGEYVKDHPGTKFYSIDNDQTHLETAKRICEGLPVEFRLGDSLYWLGAHTDESGSTDIPLYETVDLLYLDSWDCDPNPEIDNVAAQMHQLKEFQAIEGRLSTNCVLLLDDAGFENGGKSKLLRQYLESKAPTVTEYGWYEIWSGYQLVWVKHL